MLILDGCKVIVLYSLHVQLNIYILVQNPHQIRRHRHVRLVTHPKSTPKIADLP